MKWLSIITLVAAAGIMPGAPLYAQQVDYTGMEQLFGEPVTTSATGKPQRVSQTPVSMDIITAEDIRKSGAIDIPQLLSRVAGVDVTRSFKSHADVNIRGYNDPFSHRVLTLINGRQVYIDNFGMTMWNGLPVQLSEIKQIEIVRGPNTSLFGFNAASGVINIVTFNPLQDKVNVIDARIGTQDHHELSGVTTIKPSENFAIRASGSGMESDDYSRTNLSHDVNADAALGKVSFNMDGQYRINDTSDLRFEYGMNKHHSDNTIPFFVAAQLENIAHDYRMQYTNDTGEYGLWTLNAYRNDVDTDIQTTKFGGTLIEPSSKNILHVVQLSNLWSPTTDHTLRFGTEYRNNEISGGTIGPADSSFSMDVVSGNVMWLWQLSNELAWTNSARVDWWTTHLHGGKQLVNPFLTINPNDYNRNDVEYSYNSGLTYKASPVDSYRLSAARGLHVPSLVELARASSVTGAETYGNPNLNTEINNTVELGYTRDLPEQKMSVSGNIFYQRLTDIISSTVRPLGFFGGNGGSFADFTFENTGDSESLGLEAIVKGKAFNDQFNWEANYSYIQVWDSVDGQPDHFLDFEHTQPKHKLNLLAGYTLGAWEFNSDIHFVTGSDNYTTTVGDFTSARRAAKLDDYVTLNMRIGYKPFEMTSVALEGYNLVQEHYERPALNVVNGVGGGNQIGRTLLFHVQQQF